MRLGMGGLETKLCFKAANMGNNLKNVSGRKDLPAFVKQLFEGEHRCHTFSPTVLEEVVCQEVLSLSRTGKKALI